MPAGKPYHGYSPCRSTGTPQKVPDAVCRTKMQRQQPTRKETGRRKILQLTGFSEGEEALAS